MNEQEKQATLTAVRLLAATPKSRKRLKQKLEERGFPSEMINIVLNRLEKQGVLNDRNLAASLFQTYSIYRPSGRKRIIFEMGKRGIGERAIDETLENYTAQAEREKALELAKAKAFRWQKLEKIKRQKKIYDFLLRRGFDYGIARAVLEEIETAA